MSKYIPFVIDIPGIKGHINQDGTWFFEKREAGPAVGDPEIDRIAVELYAVLATSEAKNNNEPMTVRDLYGVAASDPVVGDYCKRLLAQRVPPFGEDFLAPSDGAVIDHVIGIYVSIPSVATTALG